MSNQPPVYVGVDGSPAAVEAADLAAGEAAACGTRLVILHVGEADERVVDSALVRVRLRYPTVVHSVRHIPAETGPAVALAEYAADGCLLVVGHRGHSARHNPSAGSVAQQLIGIATLPTIVYRAIDLTCDVPEPRRVLVGLGPHGTPDTVLRFGLAEAAHRHARLDVICAPSGNAGETGFAPAVMEAVHRWLDLYPEVVSQVHIRAGIDPAIALMVESHTAQLVVVGAWTGTASQPSSIAHALVHRAACPVAVIPLGPPTSPTPAPTAEPTMATMATAG
jgi:nucleotide-binding universal stress UspA family protein